MNLLPGYMKSLVLFLLLTGAACTQYAREEGLPAISWDNEHGLQYTGDERGNRVPDFSYCGFGASEEEIPVVPVRLVIPVPDGDATELLQSAIDHLSSLPVGENGFRGTILLRRGTYRLSGRLRISASGIVIRGSGMGEDGTVLIAEGTERMTLIRICGIDDRQYRKVYKISDGYVPSGSTVVHVDGKPALKKGERVMIRRPSTQQWIDRLNMKSFGGQTEYLGWKPGQRDILWDRTLADVRGNTLYLEVPLTTELDSAFGGGELIVYSWPGRIRNTGIENIRLVSDFDRLNPRDEAHCWMAITMENVEDAWVRQVEFRHFAGSAVAVYETARRVTVEDCISVDPASEIGGQRRQTFFTMGQQCLFQRIYAEGGYHDFSAGFCAAGPNAFVQCESHLPYSFSGAVDSWASGLLFDIVNVEGQALSLKDRGQDNMGAGWSAANSMLWQCSAAHIDCYSPPTATNWAYGCWSQFAGNGIWVDPNNHILPRSLYYAQLAERLSVPLSGYSDRIMPYSNVSSTSPTPELAAELTRKAYEPALTLRQWIRDAGKRDPVPYGEEGAEVFDDKDSHRQGPAKEGALTPGNDGHVPGTGRIMPANGRLVRNGALLAGDRISVPYWRGDARPYAAAKARPDVTRFVPGRYGAGYTDDLGELVEGMLTANLVGLEHNYGLWYDRRRDDHERIRRMDGEVWAPFYELPFVRSGQGTAWDGLSKYDLTRYNPWYWQRLKEFADLAESRGIVLLHHNYFQHNILEAGAHYADFPWRTANNINGTGFPEPPNYAEDKRIFMDAQFYDTGNPVRRELHRKYIRQCLDNFAGNSNVIQLLSAEYTGPLHFMQFWLGVIREWERETGEDALVGLSATKDVQDSILEDPARSALVDIIDIRYWAYREDGSLFAPAGGLHMAPRQHARKIPPGTRSFGQVYRAVLEYRNAYPGKAVIVSEPGSAGFGWAVLLAGGSLPQLPASLPEGFLEEASTMDPMNPGPDNQDAWGMRNERGGMIVYLRGDRYSVPDPGKYGEPVKVSWMDPATGKLVKAAETVAPGALDELMKPAEGPLILWLSLDLNP
jgi:hypothetical protein